MEAGILIQQSTVEHTPQAAAKFIGGNIEVGGRKTLFALRYICPRGCKSWEGDNPKKLESPG